MRLRFSGTVDSWSGNAVRCRFRLVPLTADSIRRRTSIGRGFPRGGRTRGFVRGQAIERPRSPGRNAGSGADVCPWQRHGGEWSTAWAFGNTSVNITQLPGRKITQKSGCVWAPNLDAECRCWPKEFVGRLMQRRNSTAMKRQFGRRITAAYLPSMPTISGSTPISWQKSCNARLSPTSSERNTPPGRNAFHNRG